MTRTLSCRGMTVIDVVVWRLLEAGSSVLGVATRQDVALRPPLMPEKLKASITTHTHISVNMWKMDVQLRNAMGSHTEGT